MMIPSGNLVVTFCELEAMAQSNFVVSFPIENGDFPIFSIAMSACHWVILCSSHMDMSKLALLDPFRMIEAV